eukprot:PhF_6_TR40776/c2_g1_i6/m.61524/K07359/CAMKK2; calcium/calmodulin-dependent protein kinase kinase 2
MGCSQSTNVSQNQKGKRSESKNKLSSSSRHDPNKKADRYKSVEPQHQTMSSASSRHSSVVMSTPRGGRTKGGTTAEIKDRVMRTSEDDFSPFVEEDGAGQRQHNDPGTARTMETESLDSNASSECDQDTVPDASPQHRKSNMFAPHFEDPGSPTAKRKGTVVHFREDVLTFKEAIKDSNNAGDSNGCIVITEEHEPASPQINGGMGRRRKSSYVGDPQQMRSRMASIVVSVGTRSENNKRISIVCAQVDDASDCESLKTPTTAGPTIVSNLIRSCDEEGNKVLNEYATVATLGRGAFGKVKLAIDVNTSEPVAIKILHRRRLETTVLSRSVTVTSGEFMSDSILDQHDDDDTDDGGDHQQSPPPTSDSEGDDIFGDDRQQSAMTTAIQLVRQEIKIMSKLSHPNLVSLKAVIDDDEAEKLYMVLEYMSGGVLGSTPDPSCRECPADHHLDVAALRHQFLDVLHGLQYLHRMGIIHMDIKPENVLLDSDGVCKLADFGVSTIITENFSKSNLKKSTNSSSTTTSCDDRMKGAGGTPLFFAPEILTNQRVFHGRSTDVWAFGVTLYLSVYGVTPFAACSPDEYREKVVSQDVFCPTVATNKSITIPNVLRDVIFRTLSKEPSLRITVNQLISHPFFTDKPRHALSWHIRTWKEKHIEESSTQEELKRNASRYNLRNNCIVSEAPTASATTTTTPRQKSLFCSYDVFSRTPLGKNVAALSGKKLSLMTSQYHVDGGEGSNANTPVTANPAGGKNFTSSFYEGAAPANSSKNSMLTMSNKTKSMRAKKVNVI